MQGKLTISRPHYGDGSKKIAISVKESNSGIKFLSIEIDYDKFTECLTGLSEVECNLVVKDLHNVGKVKEVKELIFETFKPNYIINKNEVKKMAISNTPEGWECSLYFNSQNSFFEKDGKHFARTTIYRYIE